MKATLISALLPLLLGGCAAMNAKPASTLAANSSYVSMGSSFAAGAGIGPLQQGADEKCSRTVNNYASLLANRLDLKLIDVSCGGATTDHILGKWNERPPQIDAVQRDTNLVTVTIGGNDLGYVGWLFSSSCRLGVSLLPGPCRSVTEPSEADYQKLDQNLRNIAKQVRGRAPQARLVFIQYVTLLSATACSSELISPADSIVARRMAERLAAITQSAAHDSGADVLQTDIISQKHTPCSAIPWSNGLSRDYDRAQGSAWHPNTAGHAAIADLLFRLLSSS